MLLFISPKRKWGLEIHVHVCSARGIWYQCSPGIWFQSLCTGHEPCSIFPVRASSLIHHQQQSTSSSPVIQLGNRGWHLVNRNIWINLLHLWRNTNQQHHGAFMGPVVLSEYTLDSPSKFLKIPVSEIYRRQVIWELVYSHLTGQPSHQWHWNLTS